MAPTTLALTHYFPWDGDEEKAVCGTPMRGDTARHSLNPTCAVCAAALAAADDKIDETVAFTLLPLDAAEAADMSPVGAALFALGVSLNRDYAARLRQAEAVAFPSTEVQLVLKGVRR